MRWFSLFIFIIIYVQTISSPPLEQLLPVSVHSEEIDPRVVALERYLLSKKSPLAGAALDFILVADNYSFDWTLLPAIAGVESGFEKAGNLSDYNPFGYMCRSRPCAFTSYSEAITRVGRTLGEGRAYAPFRDKQSIYELAKTYNHVSPEDWTRKVRYFQQQIGGE